MSESQEPHSPYRDGRLRQELIYSIVLHKGEIRSMEIAEAAQRTLATVRRPGLARTTWPGRAHLGWRQSALADQLPRELRRRGLAPRRGKRAISGAAAELVESGMVVGVSGGTTCTELGRRLRGKSGLPERSRSPLYLPPLQLIAYCRAVQNGLDPDNPHHPSFAVQLAHL